MIGVLSLIAKTTLGHKIEEGKICANVGPELPAVENYLSRLLYRYYNPRNNAVLYKIK
jgi:hypothetical protein